MKPTFPNFETSRQRDSFASSRKGSTLPKTDYHFQPPSAEFRGHRGGNDSPSFRGISNNYFKNEARSHLAVEAVVFGVILVTAAAPVFQAIRGLFQYVYGVL